MTLQIGSRVEYLAPTDKILLFHLLWNLMKK